MQIRPMTLPDLVRALDWAAAEGWNPGRDDAPAFLAADPGGFLLGEADGAAVAAISAVRHAPGVGFIGLYLVRPDRRGRGLGLALWNAAIARLDGRAIGLDGVVAQQANYRRSGFGFAHRNARWSGRPNLPQPGRTTPLAEVPFGTLLAFDAAVAGYPRPAFLRAWTAETATRRGAALIRDGALVGYGVIRDCLAGAKIGPLFAQDAQAAETLLAALAARTTARPLILDIPDPNTAAAALAARLGFAPDFETARMWRGAAPAEDLGRTFGVATFELG